MERESFRDKATAELLNRHFVSIKVDREERPDLDAVYMKAVVALTGRGGWPLSVWLTPEGVPFFGGTYFPPEPRFGLPSFRQILASVAQLWETRRGDILAAAEQLRGHLQQQAATPTGLPLAFILTQALRVIRQTFDPESGGWGGAPKFPAPLLIEFLLALDGSPSPFKDALSGATEGLADSQRPVVGHSEPQLQVMIQRTLDAMAAGGLYDHLGGGFHRYAVDTAWRVPHFEKMLYDNAQLARCYLHAWQATGKELYREVAVDTLDYLVREMRGPAGSFYASLDAESEGREGAFYTWTLAQLHEVLDPTEVRLAEKIFGVTSEGHVDGASVLHRLGSNDLPPEELSLSMLPTVKAKLLGARNRRERPRRDEKIVAGWNGLALAAFAEAANVLGSPEYLRYALAAGRFLHDHLLTEEGKLLHTFSPGTFSPGPSSGGTFGPSRDKCDLEGFLDDYASVAEGFLSLYQATFDERWFVAARALCDRAVARFRVPGEGFFDTGPEHEQLLTRPRSLSDSPTPAGCSLLATVLLKMHAYTGEDTYRGLAEEALAPLTTTAIEAPTLAGQWLLAALMAEHSITRVALVGDPDLTSTNALLATVLGQYLPLLVVALRAPGQPTSIASLGDYQSSAEQVATAWICRGTACSPATSDPKELARLLAYQRDPLEREPPP